MTNLGVRLREIRDRREISREELAKGVRTSAETLRKIEEGLTKSPRVHLIFNLAKKLNVTPEYLLFGDENRREVDNSIISPTEQDALKIKLPEQVVIDDNIRRELERRLNFELVLIQERQSQNT